MHAGEEDSTSLNYSQTAKIPKSRAAKPYFNCDHYIYFPGDNTILSTDDSLALFSYATSVKVEYSRDPAVHAKEFSKLDEQKVFEANKQNINKEILLSGTFSKI